MAFNPGQLDVLRLLLNLSPEQRNQALQAVLEQDGAPMSPVVRRPPGREAGYRTPGSGSDDSSVTAASDDGNGSGKKRVHTKNRITRLATKICQEYLNSQRMWSYLYGDNNRVVEHKFEYVLNQVKPTLTYEEQKTMKTHREQLKRCLKKRMASGKRYRSKQQLVGKFVAEAHMSKTIDLTANKDEDNEATVNNEDNVKKEGDDGSTTLTEPSLSETSGEPKAEESKPKAKDSKNRRQKAADFYDRMHKRRNAKKVRKQAQKAEASVEDEVSGEASGEAETVAKKKSKRGKTTKRKQATPAAAPQAKPTKRKQSTPAATKKSRRRSQRTKTKSKSPDTVTFPLGTRVARDFDGVVYTGEITKLYPDTPHMCQITYSDGDTEDMEAGQVEYANQLYSRDYAGK